MERSFKSDNESSTVEDYVYKLPPPKCKSDVRLDTNFKAPSNLPKDVITSLNIKTVSNMELFE